MARVGVRVRRVWTDGYGRDHDIEDMDDDYILNCIAMLNRWRREWSEVADTYKIGATPRLKARVEEIEADIHMFVTELEARHG